MKTKIAFFALLFMMTGVVSAASITVTDADGIYTLAGGEIEQLDSETVHLNSGTLYGDFTHTFEIMNTATKSFRLWVDGTASSTTRIGTFSVKVDEVEIAVLDGSNFDIGVFNSIILSVADFATMVIVGTGFSGASYGVTMATPIPAAVWLFGSALMGLFGVSRRKSTAVAA